MREDGGAFARPDAFASSRTESRAASTWTWSMPAPSFAFCGASVAVAPAAFSLRFASNPALEAGNQAPALQALVTLNLSSASELDNLLAALLDNSTGGLNGTFQDFTNFLPTLGLNSAVMSALPNVAVVDSGIFGIPVSLAVPPPPPPPSCNGLGCLWNAVSGVVGAFVGAVVNGIEGLAGAVWNAIQAVGAYFAHIAQALAKLAEAVVSAAVGALEAVASAMEKALAALTSFVSAAILSLLHAAFAPVLQALNDYLDGVTADLARLYADSPLSDSLAFWRDVAGSLYLALLVVCGVLVVALEVANLVSGGSALVVQNLVILLVTVVIASVLALVVAPALLGLVGAAMTHGIETLVNATVQPALTGQWPCSWQKGWSAVSTPVGDLLDLVGLPFAVVLLAGTVIESRAKLPGLEFLGRMIGLTVAVLAIVFDVRGAIDEKNGDHADALTLSVLGEEFAIFGIAAEATLEIGKFSKAFQTIDLLATVLDVVGTALASPVLYLSGQNCGP